MKSRPPKPVKRIVMRTVVPLGRKSNESYRVREHLTEAEVGKLLKALKANRHGHRDWLIGLLLKDEHFFGYLVNRLDQLCIALAS